jgi:hypothetical protein
MHARVSRQGLPAFSCTPPSFAIVVNRTLKKEGEKKLNLAFAKLNIVLA